MLAACEMMITRKRHFHTLYMYMLCFRLHCNNLMSSAAAETNTAYLLSMHLTQHYNSAIAV